MISNTSFSKLEDLCGEKINTAYGISLDTFFRLPREFQHLLTIRYLNMLRVNDNNNLSTKVLKKKIGDING